MDELSRAPHIVTGTERVAPAPGEGHIPDGAVITDHPPLESRFGLYRQSTQPLGPFVMLEVTEWGWRVRPEAWPAAEQRTIMLQPTKRGQGPDEWWPAEEIEKGDGFLKSEINPHGAPPPNRDGMLGASGSASPMAEHEQGGP